MEWVKNFKCVKYDFILQCTLLRNVDIPRIAEKLMS